MLEKVKGLLTNNGYNAIGATTDHDAVRLFKSNNIDAVIIGGGVENDSRVHFRTEFSRLKPLIKIIDAHPQTVLSELGEVFGG